MNKSSIRYTSGDGLEAWELQKIKGTLAEIRQCNKTIKEAKEPRYNTRLVAAQNAKREAIDELELTILRWNQRVERTTKLLIPDSAYFSIEDRYKIQQAYRFLVNVRENPAMRLQDDFIPMLEKHVLFWSSKDDAPKDKDNDESQRDLETQEEHAHESFCMGIMHCLSGIRATHIYFLDSYCIRHGVIQELAEFDVESTYKGKVDNNKSATLQEEGSRDNQEIDESDSDESDGEESDSGSGGGNGDGDGDNNTNV